GAERLFRVADDDRRLEPIGNQIDVRVAEPAVDGIGAQEIARLARHRRPLRPDRPAPSTSFRCGRRRGRRRAAARTRSHAFRRRGTLRTFTTRRPRRTRSTPGTLSTFRTRSTFGTSSTLITSSTPSTLITPGALLTPSSTRGDDDRRAATRLVVGRRQRARVQSRALHRCLAGLLSPGPHLDERRRGVHIV